jgi:GntR family transcriptional regulator
MIASVRPLKTKSSLSIQAQQYLRDLIKQGTYQPGNQLPSESELAAQLGISRPTLREALRNLEVEGVIVRKHGVGTFVAPTYGHRLEAGLEVLESLESIALRIGLKTQMGEAVIEERPAQSVEMDGLGLDAPAQILSVARAILVDAQPVAYLWDAVPVEYLRKDDLDETFSGSVLDVLLKRGQLALAHSYTSLAAVVADASLARRLHIQRNAPLLKLEAKLYAQTGQVVDYSISYFVPGYFNFHVVRRISA